MMQNWNFESLLYIKKKKKIGSHCGNTDLLTISHMVEENAYIILFTWDSQALIFTVNAEFSHAFYLYTYCVKRLLGV